MTPSATAVEDAATVGLRSSQEKRAPEFRLQPIMRQGTPSSIPETWLHFPTVEDARQLVKQMYQDDRVLRVFIVTDEAPPRFVEWVER